MVNCVTPCDREGLKLTSLNPRSLWRRIHPPIKSAIPIGVADEEFPLSMSFSRESMVLRVLGLVRLLSVLVYRFSDSLPYLP